MSDYDSNLAVPRAGGLRTIRIVLVLACIGIIANSVVGGILIGENAQRINEVNEERYGNTIRNCADVNRRHDNALRALNVLYAERVRRVTGPRERELVRQSRVSSALLIEALTPKRDCRRLAREQIDRSQ
jgi:hypothetical protein